MNMSSEQGVAQLTRKELKEGEMGVLPRSPQKECQDETSFSLTVSSKI